MLSLKERFKRSWNVFRDRDPTDYYPMDYSFNSSITNYRPDRYQLTTANVRSIVGSMFNKIAVDVSQVDIRHVRNDADGNFKEIIKSDLNRCLSIEANLDQTGRDLIRDISISMFDEGCVAAVPVTCDFDPEDGESYKIYEIRVGKIIEWMPHDVRVSIYNEDTGYYEELVVPKRITAILENPFYEIMNEPNSTKQRLMRILNQIDKTNAQASSGKLDMIIQLPYAIKKPSQLELANVRRQGIEEQLNGSQLGIAYIDATERVIQLNRSLDNNLWEQAIELTNQLYSQLGLSKAIFDGTADEQTMLNYSNSTLEPVLTEIVEQMQRKWISRTAETQGQAIRFFRDPFKLVPLAKAAEVGDAFLRNRIMTSNEMRSKLGMKPSDSPDADKLENPNLNHPEEKEEVKEEIRVEKESDEISK